MSKWKVIYGKKDINSLNEIVTKAIIVKFDDFMNNRLNLNKNEYHAIPIITQNIVFLIYGINLLADYENIISKLYISKLYISKQTISETVSRKMFNNKIDTLLLTSKLTEKKITDADISSIINYFLELPVQNYQFIKNVNGICLKNNDKPCKLGPFILYNRSFYMQNIMLNPYKDNKDMDSILWQGFTSDYIVTINIKARDTDKVKDIAYELLNQLELFIYYSIGEPNPKFDITIVSRLAYPYENHLILCDQEITRSTQNNRIELIPLDVDYFKDVSIGNDIIWTFINNSNLDEMKTRIVSAIEWIGKANSENNIKNQLLFYLIAIESVFTRQEKTLVSPSIASTICESAAYVLSTDAQERISIEKIIKELYEIRSAIAHGSEKKITKENIKLACHISVSIVRQFLTNDELKNICKIQDFANYIKLKKYS